MIVNLTYGKNASGNYLPLSGGTMTGPATFVVGSTISSNPEDTDNSTKIATASWWQSHFAVLTVTSGTITVNANTYAASTFSVTKSGYTPMALVGYSGKNGTNFQRIKFYRLTYASNNIYYGLRNIDNAAAKIIMTVYILYKKG